MNRKGIVVLLILAMVGLCLLFVGRVIGANRTLDINLFGLRFEASGMGFRNIERSGESGRSGEMTLVNERNLPAFTDIDISLVNTNIQLEPASYYGVEIRYPAERDINWEVRNGKLFVKDNTNRTFSINRFDGDSYVIVYSPADKMDMIKLATVSGTIKIDEYNAQSITINTVSGEIISRGCKSRKLNIETVSGSITQEKCTSEDIRLVSVSGRIHYETELQDTQYNINLSSVSGRVTVNGESVSRTDYGNLGGRGAPYNLSAETVSGRIELLFNR